MLPPLEDRGLAARSTAYTLSDLLSYSAICGLGIDCVPIAGDTPPPGAARSGLLGHGHDELPPQQAAFGAGLARARKEERVARVTSSQLQETSKRT